MKKSFYLSTTMIFMLTLTSFVLTPFTADTKAFFASANQAAFIGRNLFYDAYNSWELKSVFARVLNYIIYKIATVFVEFGTFPFERMAKLIYVCFVMAVGMLVVWLVDRKERLLHRMFEVMVLTIFFTASELHSHMEVEMTCSLILVLGFALYINAEESEKNGTVKRLLAGCCIGSLFFFKSVLLIMSVSFAAAAWIWDINDGKRMNAKKFFQLVGGSLIVLILGLITILIMNPAEISDILNASIFQTTLLNGGKFSLIRIGRKFCGGYIDAMIRFPVLLLTVFAAIGNVVEEPKKIINMFMHAILWLMPAVFIILSNQYFPYHFFMFTFPAIFELYLNYKKHMTFNDFKWNWVTVGILISIFFTLALRLVWTKVPKGIQYVAPFVILALVIVLLGAFLKGRGVRRYASTAAVVLACFLYMMFFSVFSMNCFTAVQVAKASYAKNAFVNQIDFSDPVLYLDDGTGAYILGAKSYLKYFFPLPVQRISEDSEYKNRACRLDSLEQIEEYTGEYVTVYEKWMFSNGRNEKIKEKIENDYEIVAELAKYSPNRYFWFVGDTEESIVTISLYKRK